MRRRKTQVVTPQQIELDNRENHTREIELLEKSHQTLWNCRPLNWLSHVSNTLVVMSSVSRKRDFNTTLISLDSL